MSWLSDRLHGSGKVLNKIKSVALPAIGFALGGPAGAAAAGALSGAIGNGKPKLKNIGMVAASGLATGMLGGAAGLTGGQGIGKMIGSAKDLGFGGVGSNLLHSVGIGGGAGAAGGASAAGSAAGGVQNIAQIGPRVSSTLTPQALASVAGGGGGGAMGTLQKIGGFALKNKDLLLGGLSAAEGYKSDKSADAMRKRQYDMAMANWNQTAPLRTMGQNMMLDQKLEDMSKYQNRSNPFTVG